MNKLNFRHRTTLFFILCWSHSSTILINTFLVLFMWLAHLLSFHKVRQHWLKKNYTCPGTGCLYGQSGLFYPREDLWSVFVVADRPSVGVVGKRWGEHHTVVGEERKEGSFEMMHTHQTHITSITQYVSMLSCCLQFKGNNYEHQIKFLLNKGIYFGFYSKSFDLSHNKND